MRRKADYRSHEGSKADMELMALRELAYRVKRLRARVLFPLVAAAIVIGHAGIAAHATGRWALFGRMSDGSYLLSPVTIVIAFLVPALPFLVVCFILHRILGARLRRAWCDEFEQKHGLAREVLERSAGRYG